MCIDGSITKDNVDDLSGNHLITAFWRPSSPLISSLLEIPLRGYLSCQCITSSRTSLSSVIETFQATGMGWKWGHGVVSGYATCPERNPYL